MVSISLCMIIENDEQTIDQCLSSVKDMVDEIVLINIGSTDTTKEIAKKYNAKIYDYAWTGDFSAVRNFSVSMAACEFILWLDADDMLLEKDGALLKQLKMEMDNNLDIISMKYSSVIQNTLCPICTYSRERLMKRDERLIWHGRVYEYVDLYGVTRNTDICITSIGKSGLTSRKINMFADLISNKEEPALRDLFFHAKELLGRGRFEEAAGYFKNFLNTESGLISYYVEAGIDLAACFYASGDTGNALKALISCFEFGCPRAEVCCAIGYHYKDLKQYKTAVIWFELAAKIPNPGEVWGPVIRDYWRYIPYTELSECYKELENCNEEKRYKLMAAAYTPINCLMT